MRTQEDWKNIKGYEGKYMISNRGRVFSVKSNRVLNGSLDRGYLYVSLRKNTRVHRLVAEAFIDNPHSFPHCNHKDGNKLNNTVDNLEWCTNEYNVKHAWKNGLMRTARGERNNTAKLTSKQVKMIRKEYIPYKNSVYMLGRKYGVSYSTIMSIIRGRNWGWLK